MQEHQIHMKSKLFLVQQTPNRTLKTDKTIQLITILKF